MQKLYIKEPVSVHYADVPMYYLIEVHTILKKFTAW